MLIFFSDYGLLWPTHVNSLNCECEREACETYSGDMVRLNLNYSKAFLARQQRNTIRNRHQNFAATMCGLHFQSVYSQTEIKRVNEIGHSDRHCIQTV